MQKIEINGKLCPVIYQKHDYIRGNEFMGIQTVIYAYNNNIYKVCRKFEDFGYESPDYKEWSESIQLCSIDELKEQ